MSEFKVESGIEVAARPRQQAKLKYPWPVMQVGDSFFIPVNDNDRVQKQSSVQSSGRQWGVTHNGAIFCTRTVEENGKRGIRVWRTA